MENEDPQERPEYITLIINGLERYNPEAIGTLEDYLRQQCEQRFCDCNANRTLLKLYQLNPDRIKDEVITNILVKCLTCFPSPQFALALHLIVPAALAPTARGELPEAIAKLRELSARLEGAQYARFWATLDSDDLYADMTTDIDGFEDLIRLRIAALVASTFRELDLRVLEQWLGLDGPDAAARFVRDSAGWRVDDDGLVRVPRNAENEAKKTEVREDVHVDMFSRVMRRAWEETTS